MTVQEVKATKKTAAVTQVAAVRAKRKRVRQGDKVSRSTAEATRENVVNDALKSPYANQSGDNSAYGSYLDPIAILLFLLKVLEKTSEETQSATGRTISGQIEGIKNMANQEAAALHKQGELMSSEMLVQAVVSSVGAALALGSAAGSIGAAIHFKSKLAGANKELQDGRVEAAGGEAVLGKAEKTLQNESNEQATASATSSQASKQTDDNDEAMKLELEKASEANLPRSEETVAEKNVRDDHKQKVKEIHKTWDSANTVGQTVGQLGQLGSQAGVAGGTMALKVEQKTQEGNVAQAQATKQIIQAVLQLVQEVYSKAASRLEQTAGLVAEAGNRFAAATAA